MTDTRAPCFDPYTPAGDPVADPAAERVARHCRILAELAEIGLRLTRSLERQAAARDPVADPASDAASDAAPGADGGGGSPVTPFRGDLGLVFNRLTRAIRLTLVLETQIAEGEVARLATAAAVRAKAAHAAQGAQADAWAEAQTAAVLQVVEQTLEADGQDDETIIERLRETEEFLDSGDLDYDLVELPTGLVIAHICKAFGVTPDWSLWADTDWAIEEAREGLRGSPFVRRGFGGDGAAAPPGAEAEVAEPVSGSP